MTLTKEWDKVEALLDELRTEMEAYAHTETLMQHQINGLESEVERLKGGYNAAIEAAAKVVETHSEYGFCLDGVSQEMLAAAIRALTPRNSSPAADHSTE
jgi:chromosome segregation ATPase